MRAFVTLPHIVAALVLALCGIMPYLAPAMGEPFLIGLFALAMIWGIAALSLNLIMGYGGMISFGHAVYLGVASYTVGIFAFHGVTDAWIQWPAALAISALVAFIFGCSACSSCGGSSIRASAWSSAASSRTRPEWKESVSRPIVISSRLS